MHSVGHCMTPFLLWIVCHTSLDSCIQPRYQLLYGIWAHRVGQSMTLYYMNRGSFTQARSPLVYGLERTRCISPEHYIIQVGAPPQRPDLCYYMGLGAPLVLVQNILLCRSCILYTGWVSILTWALVHQLYRPKGFYDARHGS